MVSNLATIYIGGGTPTSLNLKELNRLLELIKPYSNNVIEYTIEINPETFDADKALLLKKYGINRASIGLQSTNIKELTLMNRKHSLNDVKNTVDLLSNVGIDNYSLDIMYSLPSSLTSVPAYLEYITLSPTFNSILTSFPSTIPPGPTSTTSAI